MPMREQAHPGEVVRALCIEPLGLTVTEAAAALGGSRKTLLALLNGRAGISPEMAIRLSRAFGGKVPAMAGTLSWRVCPRASFPLSHRHGVACSDPAGNMEFGTRWRGNSSIT